MKIERVNLYKPLLSFVGDFSISQKKWHSANNIVVEIIADQGECKGYGEGAPRQYITGEPTESISKSACKRICSFIHEDTFPWELNDVSQIWDFLDILPKGSENNAAICAIEMALLDALGKAQNKYITDYFSKDFYAGTVHYQATITLGNKQRIKEISQLIKKLGINHLRVKMGKDFKQNQETLETVNRVYGNDCDISLDPNSVWDRELAFKHIPLIKKYNVKVVEEPMMSDNPALSEFVAVMRSVGVMLMACHSATTLEDMERIVSNNHYQMVNVKLSRSGGFRRSLRIIDYLRTNKRFFQIGCHLGESGVLSAGGRALSLLSGDALCCDGSYDQFLLKENITKKHVTFGPGGEAGPLDDPGLGAEIDKECLVRLSDGAPIQTISNPFY